MIQVSEEQLEMAGMNQTDLDDARADAVRASHALIDRFVEADAMPAVYTAYGEVPPDSDDRYGKLAHAEAFGNKYLDWRRGTPRRRDAPELPKQQAEALVALGEETGMTGESNAHDVPVDLVLVQGSYKEGVFHRTRLGKEQIQAQSMRFPEHPPVLIGMGIERPLTDEDFASKVDYAPEAKTEYDLVTGAIEAQFGVTSPGDWVVSEDEHGVPYPANPGLIRSYGIPGVFRTRALSAPRVEGTRFANTADTHHFAVRFAGLSNILGKTVLGTTTQVYEPFQRADMLRVWGLQYGMQVEMAGYHDDDWTKPAHIGQEVNSLFDQSTMLVRAIRDVQTQRQAVKTILDIGK